MLTLSPRYILGSQIPVDDHSSVMVYMQKCHLIVFFPENEKYLKPELRYESYCAMISVAN